MSHKPVVHYRPAPMYPNIVEGQQALVYPIDHTNHAVGQYVSNTTLVATSRVVKVCGNGEFETLNTIYRLADNNNNKEPENAVSKLQRNSE